MVWNWFTGYYGYLLGKLILVGHSRSISNATDVVNFLSLLRCISGLRLDLGIRNVDILQQIGCGVAAAGG